jgi:hypothetical protein
MRQRETIAKASPEAHPGRSPLLVFGGRLHVSDPPEGARIVDAFVCEALDIAVSDSVGLLDHPVWAALMPKPYPGGELFACRVRATDIQADAYALREQLAQLPSGSGVLVVADRRSVRRLFAGLRRPVGWWLAPTVEKLADLLNRAGIEVDARLLVWPSADNARIVADADASRVWRWAQRTGVLGSGGSGRFRRRLFRSRAFGGLVQAMTAGAALTGRKR